MSDQPRLAMPESLLWLANELYWKQDLSMPKRSCTEDDAPRPFRAIPKFPARSL